MPTALLQTLFDLCCEYNKSVEEVRNGDWCTEKMHHDKDGWWRLLGGVEWKDELSIANLQSGDDIWEEWIHEIVFVIDELWSFVCLFYVGAKLAMDILVVQSYGLVCLQTW